MTDELPGVSRPGRIVIDEADLAPVAPQPAPAPPSSTRSARPSPPPAAAHPAQPAQAPKPAPLPQHDPPTVGSYCSGCGAPLHVQAVVCPRCGVPARAAAEATTAAMTVAINSKSPAAAILLSLVFTGAGQWYVGRVGRGFAFFAAAVVSGILILAVVGLVLLPIVWVCAAIDANNCARKHNAELMRQAGFPGTPPTLNA